MDTQICSLYLRWNIIQPYRKNFPYMSWHGKTLKALLCELSQSQKGKYYMISLIWKKSNQSEQKVERSLPGGRGKQDNGELVFNGNRVSVLLDDVGEVAGDAGCTAMWMYTSCQWPEHFTKIEVANVTECPEKKCHNLCSNMHVLLCSDHYSVF
jgi:hypothetical protein